MNPVGRNHAQHFVDLEHAARSRAEVHGDFVLAHQMEIDRAAGPHERVEADVRRAIRPDADEPAQLLYVDEAVDRLRGNVGVVGVKDHAATPSRAFLTMSQK